MLRRTETGALDNLPSLGRITRVIGIQFSPPLSLTLQVSFVACTVLELRNLPNFAFLGLELEACVTQAK